MYTVNSLEFVYKSWLLQLHTHMFVHTFTIRSSHIISVRLRFFQKMGDYSSALQFLVLSKCSNEAFVMAEVATCIYMYDVHTIAC